MLEAIFKILYGTLYLYFAFSVLYLFFFSLSGRWFYRRKSRVQTSVPGGKRIALLVPAYKEDGIIVSTAENLLSLDYPKHLYDVYIIADSFREETLEELRRLPVQVLEVSFEKSTKTRALNEAFRRIGKPYDIALICDADNMLAPDFLNLLTAAFNGGAGAVQGRRVAKNLDTPFAILDACSEGINNNIFRKGYNGAGLSSAVIGSGMAFGYDLLKEILGKIDAVGGFDKILQLEIVKRGIKIVYLEDALVFDEKVSDPAAFQQQRRRWVSSQFIYFRRFLLPAFGELFSGNLSYFNLAVLGNLVLPRAFLLLLLPLFAALSFLVSAGWGIAATGLWLLYLVTLATAVPGELVNRDFYRAVAKLPRAVFLMLGTILQVRKANKTFIHTVHTKTEISNLILHGNKKKNG